MFAASLPAKSAKPVSWSFRSKTLSDRPGAVCSTQSCRIGRPAGAMCGTRPRSADAAEPDGAAVPPPRRAGFSARAAASASQALAPLDPSRAHCARQPRDGLLGCHSWDGSRQLGSVGRGCRGRGLADSGKTPSRLPGVGKHHQNLMSRQAVSETAPGADRPERGIQVAD